MPVTVVVPAPVIDTTWSGAELVTVTTPLAAFPTLIPVPAARLVFFQ